MNLQIPDNINKILKDKEIWEENSFNPILVNVMNCNYNGKDVLSYQMQFDVDDEIGNLGRTMSLNDTFLDGDEWEDLIRRYIRLRNKELEEKIHSDSESSTCVIWLEEKNDFLETFKFVIELINIEDGKIYL
ncbi:MAG: hypothetical protein H7Y00_14235 [Fimbriimonadaceae bacterium]|nr:hypothetical protein [Chitinophagales bacterium]